MIKINDDIFKKIRDCSNSQKFREWAQKETSKLPFKKIIIRRLFELIKLHDF